MRTKTLLFTAVLGAAGILSSVAQTTNPVYSVNVVGYVNLTIPTGFTMIANPLRSSSDTVSNLFNGAPDGITIYKFNGTTFTGNALDFGSWNDPNQTLNPGEGAFIFNSGSPFTNTFVGEVMQGALTNPIPAGFSIRASQVPQEGALDTELGFPVQDGDTIYRFSGNGYVGHAYDFGSWTAVPRPRVAESFFVFTSTSKNWTRNFTVPQN